MRRLRPLLTIALLCAFAACGSPSTTESPTATPTAASSPTAKTEPTAAPRPAATAEPTAAPEPTVAPSVAPAPPTLEPATAVPDAALTAELSATVGASLPPTATPKPGEGAGFAGISGVGALPLQAAGEPRPLWAVYSQGERSFDPPQNHFVAIYARGDSGWRELSRLELEDPDIITDGGAEQVQVEPANIWLEVQSGVGAHGGCYNLLRFDGQVLRQEVAHCYESPGAGYLADLNGDGVQEVILNQTRNYVFCYACGVRQANFQVLRWDGAKMVEVALTPPPDSAPAELRRLTNQAIALAQAGLWKDAQATISQTLALNMQDEMATWDAALIRLVAEARAEQAESGAYPLLDQLFYGDYAATLDVMRPYTPEQLFGAESPLVVGTTAEGWEPQLAGEITTTVDMALALKPDLAAAYFLRGWAIHLTDPASPGVLADIERAAQIDPNEALFTRSLEFLRK